MTHVLEHHLQEVVLLGGLPLPLTFERPVWNNDATELYLKLPQFDAFRSNDGPHQVGGHVHSHELAKQMRRRRNRGHRLVLREISGQGRELEDVAGEPTLLLGASQERSELVLVEPRLPGLLAEDDVLATSRSQQGHHMPTLFVVRHHRVCPSADPGFQRSLDAQRPRRRPLRGVRDAEALGAALLYLMEQLQFGLQSILNGTEERHLFRLADLVLIHLAHGPIG
mmetsp:Transcript_56703/g.143636  ORF Transcript_56703/g.143636 Transcript_56703/m.143636 type:complete len:225 (+) Transcript_56703:924-1598(+)